MVIVLRLAEAVVVVLLLLLIPVVWEEDPPQEQQQEQRGWGWEEEGARLLLRHLLIWCLSGRLTGLLYKGPSSPLHAQLLMTVTAGAAGEGWIYTGNLQPTFVVNSGPCTVAEGGRCVGRWPGG